MRKLVAGLSITGVVWGCAHARHGAMTAASADASAYGTEVETGYAKVRAATARFRVLDSAVSAGYVATVAQCISDSVHGAMGYHHINRAYLDNKVEVERPEFLLYERHPDGSYVLNAVEYIVPFRVWPKDSVPPKLLGRDMLKNEALNLWNLHMWVWSKNPAGLFAEWNPTVHCPAPKTDYPEGYRTWSHVKSSVISAPHANFATNGGFQHVYANGQAMAGYRSRVFPEGSVVVVDWLDMRDNSGALLEGKRRQIDVMTKDSTRFASTGGWGFRRYVGDSKTELAATPKSDQCFSCHNSRKTDGLVISTYRQ